MIQIEFKAEDATRWMQQIGYDFENASFESVFKNLIPVLHEGFAENFANTSAPEGPWPPHAPATVRIHGPHPLLILSGTLLRSVTTTGSEGNVEQISGREMQVGTSMFYAAWQQHGTPKIPPRKFLWLNGQWVERVANEFAEGCIQVIFGA